MTAYAPSLPSPTATGSKLALLTLAVLVLHAVLLLGLPHWARTVPATGGPPVFQIRTIVPEPSQAVTPAAPAQAVPAPPPKPKPRSQPAPTPVPVADDNPVPVMPDSRPRTDTAQLHGRPAVLSDAQPSNLLQAPPLAVFGGTMPLPPIAPPLPSDQAQALAQQAAQLRPDGSAAPAAGAPNALPPVQLPRPAQISYQATLTQGDRKVPLTSTINWRYDGQYYDLRWTLYGAVIGDRGRAATGLVTARGLVPITAQAMGADAYNLALDTTSLRLGGEAPASAAAPASASGNAASAPTPAASSVNLPGSAPLPLGAQDPLSLLIQLGALIAGNPAQYPVGSTISLAVAGGDGQALPTLFTVAADASLAGTGHFAGQTLTAVHLVHQSANDRDPRIELWLGRQFDYLPIRLLVIPPAGDRLEMTLQNAVLQPMPSVAPASAPVPAAPTAGGR